MVSHWTSVCLFVCLSVFRFRMIWIFTKLGMCIDIVEIWFWIVNGQISSNSYVVIFPRRNNGRVLMFLYFVLYSIAPTCFRTCTKWPDWDHPCMHNISSEPLLMILLANNEGPEQTAWMHRLIWAIAVCICPKTRFCMVRPRWCNMSQHMTKPTKWHVRPVWSESSLCTKWEAKRVIYTLVLYMGYIIWLIIFVPCLENKVSLGTVMAQISLYTLRVWSGSSLSA